MTDHFVDPTKVVEVTTPPCCEAWESWADSANWFVDTEGIYRMPHLRGTRHRFNFCPSCGAERRSAIVVPTTSAKITEQIKN